jgi:undecaprenyl pyrophosphate synthase
MKQSSVDWLFDQLWETPKDKITWFKILMEAKEKHRQEIVNAVTYGNRQEHYDATETIADKYYNENFK